MGAPSLPVEGSDLPKRSREIWGQVRGQPRGQCGTRSAWKQRTTSEELEKVLRRKGPDYYRRKVNAAEPLAWQFYGANLGPTSVPQCSKCSESARKCFISRWYSVGSKRVNLDFNHLQPVGSVAFPIFKSEKNGLKEPIFVDELLTSFRIREWKRSRHFRCYQIFGTA